MPSQDNLYARISDFDAMEAELKATRHHLHANPELSFEEAETARYVADKLEAWGYAVTRNVGGHGVVATLKNGTGTKSIGIRADMDALPIEEETGVAYASTVPGKMHACGHDGHTTVLLGAAEYLARTKRFNGTVTLIFQPAEEAGQFSGAQRMIADGLFERFPIDAIFGLHNHPGMPAGALLTRAGPMMAAGDTVKITVTGKGGHASRPHLTVDPVLVACNLVMTLQSIVSRNVDPTQTAVVTVSTIHAGEASNVIPNNAKISMSVRSFDPAIRTFLEERIRKLTASVAEGHGATAEIEYEYGYPVVVNSEEETAFAREVAEELVGTDNVSTCPPLPGSEDFAYFLHHRPGSFLRLGNGKDSQILHSSKYDFNDGSLTTGSAMWARLAERYLNV
ncbi:M20 aminoacylase family protein [Neorhizobium galegae]|uniref:M20 aminoacylase family protein n=1 Tax=Neorhizobium galegae TaxID=399 RepID=UPI0006225C8D|nr:M20 aminoacylase family protein [Neorhizobium galegae]CDZ60792.1 Hippurate hydrolase [Neorhizobium galegae bv. orientalis]KAB1121652.1 amidohydrolase [Neorhizobium galegae]MCQ1574892.1 M20 family metallopeptidase [Neorhizobium galegae]MCQ1807891.1 M20 family metallopeptidase [Neorhizobium galegae]MCQ1837713.1 M20 family metallopeptidase [Neorhizobium galegae]